ncbi:MAG: hypothetical protein WB630_21830, partial [Candidatus Acidiferrales bacterium]
TQGGHVLEAKVSPTLEVMVTVDPVAMQKRFDPDTDLTLIDPAFCTLLFQPSSLPTMFAGVSGESDHGRRRRRMFMLVINPINGLRRIPLDISQDSVSSSRGSQFLF